MDSSTYLISLKPRSSRVELTPRWLLFTARIIRRRAIIDLEMRIRVEEKRSLATDVLSSFLDWLRVDIGKKCGPDRTTWSFYT